ncbi:MAG: S8 family serine peptidase [Planctomycetia bacterium]|nr:S8 family serine peptidase [Planctomycetia bacterium]
MRGQRLAGARAPRSPHRVEPSVLRIEPLEEIALLSAAAWDTDYATWLEQTFTVEAAANFQFSTDELQALGDVNASATDPSLNLIRAEAAANYGYNGAGYTVAVLDTGIDYTHSSLAGSYIGGWDFVDNDADPRDQNGHGTHVAGIIAGSASSTYPGVASGAKILSLRVLGKDGSGSFANVEKALQWVAQHQQQFNIVAVNMSLGAGNFNINPWQFLEDDLALLESRGVFLSTASGNGFSTYGSQLGLGFPATSNYTVSVGAVWSGNFGAVTFGSGAKDFSTAADRITSFSQRSAALDILAPGAFVTNAAMGGGWARLAGTSMAAPVVAGAAVLIHQALDARGLGHLATQSFILDIMQDTGVTVVDGDNEQDNVTNSWLTFKRLDVANALAAVASLGGGGGGGGGTTNPGTPGTNPGTTNPGTSNPPVVTVNPNANFVRALYRELLGRDPDSAGLAYWTQQIGGGLSRTQVAKSLSNSPEYRGRQVDVSFNDLLGRAPTSSERSYWLALLTGGTAADDMVRTVVSSGEYQSANGNLAGFVSAAYQDLLGRTAETSGVNYWVSFLSTGGTRAQFAQTLLTSSEYRLNTIDSYYQEYLGRGAGPTERQWWLVQVQSGTTTLGTIAQSFLGSDEYFASAQGASGAGALSEGLAQQDHVASRADRSALGEAILRIDGNDASSRSMRSRLATVVTTDDATQRWQAVERARATALLSVGTEFSGVSADTDPAMVDATLSSTLESGRDELLESIVTSHETDEQLHDEVVESLA